MRSETWRPIISEDPPRSAEKRIRRSGKAGADVGARIIAATNRNYFRWSRRDASPTILLPVASLSNPTPALHPSRLTLPAGQFLWKKITGDRDMNCRRRSLPGWHRMVARKRQTMKAVLSNLHALLARETRREQLDAVYHRRKFAPTQPVSKGDNRLTEYCARL